jgi:hypothetical protein
MLRTKVYEEEDAEEFVAPEAVAAAVVAAAAAAGDTGVKRPACHRVKTVSTGCTAKTATAPEHQPAKKSTQASESGMTSYDLCDQVL